MTYVYHPRQLYVLLLLALVSGTPCALGFHAIVHFAPLASLALGLVVLLAQENLAEQLFPNLNTRLPHHAPEVHYINDHLPPALHHRFLRDCILRYLLAALIGVGVYLVSGAFLGGIWLYSATLIVAALAYHAATEIILKIWIVRIQKPGEIL